MDIFKHMKLILIAFPIFVAALLSGCGDGSSTPAATAAFKGTSKITKIVIDRVESPTFEGRAFGDVGPYEKLVGKAFGEVDPTDPLNQGIVNLDKAPRNARGMVEYDIDVYILKPIDMAKGNKTLFYTVVNRGNLSFGFNIGLAGGNNPTKANDAGDGWAMRQGYTLVWSGWQGDTLPGNERRTVRFPVAKNADGSPIKKKITTEFIFSAVAPTYSVPISFDRGNLEILAAPPVEESMASATLSRRTGLEAPSELIPRNQWSFAKCMDGKTTTASNLDICYPAGFTGNYVYDLVYEARDPLVMGLGFTATRDVNSFLRYDTTDANPLVQRGGTPGRNPIQYAIGFGSSQSGRFLKDLIYQGFNQDTAGRRVFDGAIPHISGSRKTNTNLEFAQLGRFSTTLEGHHFPGDQFPFTYDTLTDPNSGKTDGVLMRCRAQGVCPKLMHWDSGTEPWSARSSLVVTDLTGTKDATIPDNVRLYYFASTQHGPAATPAKGICQQLSNPLPYRDTQRALVVALQAWVANNTEPPPTQFPKLSDGTLVPPMPQAGQGFPIIPGVGYTGKPNHMFLMDYSVVPAKHVEGKQYPVFVPKVDNDGNEIGGVRAVQLQVPIGTYSGWTLRAAGFMENEGCYLNGQYIPFAQTADQRKLSGDPRISLEERYGSQQKYVDETSAAAIKLVAGRFLLEEDAVRLIKQAQAENLGFVPK